MPLFETSKPQRMRANHSATAERQQHSDAPWSSRLHATSNHSHLPVAEYVSIPAHEHMCGYSQPNSLPLSYFRPKYTTRDTRGRQTPSFARLLATKPRLQDRPNWLGANPWMSNAARATPTGVRFCPDMTQTVGSLTRSSQNASPLIDRKIDRGALLPPDRSRAGLAR